MTRPSAVAAAVLAAVLTVGGCGIRPTGITGSGSKPRAGGRADEITVYLVKDGGLTAVTRPGLPGHPYLAIGQLSVQPTEQERRRGMRSDVPASLSARRAPKPAGLSVYVQPGRWPEPPEWPRTAFGQIACTADAIPGIDHVSFWDWRNESNRVLVCDDFADLLG